MASTTALRWAPEHSGVPEVPSGTKTSMRSPLPERPAPSAERISWPGNYRAEYKGEAMHTIPEECERLFCDTLSATFLGEGIGAEQESLGMGAFQNIQPEFGHDRDRIQKWVEVWDYAGDAIYRGFVADMNGERTFFVFFEDGAMGHGLKSGLIALFELAGVEAFDCSQIVACVKRTQHTNEMELVRSLGWCGFNLTTLEPWSTAGASGPFLSPKWLFLAAEV
ncbi:hypothetical protein N7533_007957 [Penicillium manginii]|uniref:uncharacterized protein n=1 Tax=Penicillium manginii TaxID=203109 RepID=UPI002546E678|nr:uncharacterized protein N7533_007957 [Penicillium manginii]KAJ5750929.1 hypothetical protein N7533_007957 [Penicillium manginii]